MTDSIARKDKTALFLIGVSFVCWWRLLFLKGIWWDDWAWTWHYFASGSLEAFLAPFESLRHIFDGYLLFVNLRLFDIAPQAATNIWNILKFVIFTVNPVLMYYILKKVLSGPTILPGMIAAIYAASPVINNLCLVEFSRRIYLLCFLLSMLFFINAINGKRFNVVYYISALIFSSLSMLGLESFVFFDLLRPLVAFYILYGIKREGLFNAIKKTVALWLPFLLIGMYILADRMGLLVPRSGIYFDAYVFTIPSAGAILSQCINSVIYLFTDNIRFFVKRLFLKGPDIALTIESLFVTFIALTLIFRNRYFAKAGKADAGLLKKSAWSAAFGFFMILTGLFPYVLARGGYGFGVVSRHGLLASVGISVFIPSVLIALYRGGFIRKTFFYFLLGSVIFLSVFQCNAAVKAYENDWSQQSSFWRQFIAKVPDIKDDAYLIVDMPREEIAYFNGGWRGSYEFACPLNLLYAKSKDNGRLYKNFADTFETATDTGENTSYVNNINKDEVRFESFGGTRAYYPKNLIAASCYGRRLFLNNEVNSVNSPRNNIALIVSHSSPGQIVFRKEDVNFPFRRIIPIEG